LEFDKKKQQEEQIQKLFIHLYIYIMGKFEKQQEKKQEQKEKEKTRCEALGKFYFDLAKLVFAALVLGGMFPYFRRMIVTLLQTQIHTL